MYYSEVRKACLDCVAALQVITGAYALGYARIPPWAVLAATVLIWVYVWVEPFNKRLRRLACEQGHTYWPDPAVLLARIIWGLHLGAELTLLILGPLYGAAQLVAWAG